MKTTAPAAVNGGPLAAILFCLAFLFIVVTLDPFPSLAITYAGQLMEGSNPLLNQFLLVFIAGAAGLLVVRQRGAELLLRPRVLLIVLFSWFVLTAFLGEMPMTSLKRIIETLLVIGASGALLLLPRDEGHFARLIAFCTLAVLVLCYAGVLFAPGRAIHQASDYLEPALAGDWRGLFEHKNAAAATMVLFVFIGLYLSKRWSALGGWLIVALSALFLLQSGGKTALGLLPVTLLAVWVMEKLPALRLPIVIGALTSFALLTVGVVAFPSIKGIVSALGVESTFTGRTDIWQLAFDSFYQHPMTGYGFQAFWQRPELQVAFREESTWAVLAAHAHNGYLDILLSSGVPGLALALVWLLVLPLRDISTISKEKNDSPLSRLYIRLWFYILMMNMLETMLFLGTSIEWFFMIMAVFGLRYQARAHLIVSENKPEKPENGSTHSYAY